MTSRYQAHVYKFGKPDQGCQCATCQRARLDEAAPDLVEALSEAIIHLQSDAMAAALDTFPGLEETNDEVLAMLRAALAKAGL